MKERGGGWQKSFGKPCLGLRSGVESLVKGTGKVALYQRPAQTLSLFRLISTPYLSSRIIIVTIFRALILAQVLSVYRPISTREPCSNIITISNPYPCSSIITIALSQLFYGPISLPYPCSHLVKNFYISTIFISLLFRPHILTA